jgi:hypothetical protein
MAKSAELRVEIDPELLERVRKEAKRIGIRPYSLVSLALVQFLERADGVEAMRKELQAALAGQDIVNAKIEHLAEFVAAMMPSDPASKQRAFTPIERQEA